MPGRAANALLACAMAALGMGTLLLATRWGLDLDSDAEVYITYARNWQRGYGLGAFDGHGVFWQGTHYPPLYSWLLAAAATVSGADVVAAARWVQVLLFGATIAIVCLAVAGHGGGRLETFLAGLLVTGGGSLLVFYAAALSEGLFIVCGSAALLLLGLHLAHRQRALLALSAAAAAAACLTRYAGVGLVGAMAVLLLVHGAGGWRPRVMRAAVLAVVSAAPLVLWAASAAGAAAPPPVPAGGPAGPSQAVAERALGFHPATLGQLGYGPLTVARWLLPEPLLRAVAAVAVPAWGAGGAQARLGLGLLAACGLVGGAVGLAWLLPPRRWLPPPRPGITGRVVLVFVLVYAGFLVVTMSLAYPSTELSLRTLAPAYVALAVLLPGALLAWWRSLRARPLRRLALAGIVAAILGGNLAQSAVFVAGGFQEGLGLGSRAWQQSPLLARVRALPPTQLVYTNGPLAITLYTDRLVEALPAKPPAGTDESYAARLRAVESQLAAGTAVLVYFDRLGPARSLYAGLDELRQVMPLRMVAAEADGQIYTAS